MPHSKDLTAATTRASAVSIANFCVLLGLLGTAIGTWYTIVSQVTIAQAEIKSINLRLEETIKLRAEERKTLEEKDNILSKQISDIQLQTTGRLATVEAEMRSLSSGVQRIENTLIRAITETNSGRRNSIQNP